MVTEYNVVKLLRKLGMPCSLKGYEYVKEAIMLVDSDRQLYLGGITKCLYPTIAKRHNDTFSRVERAIRHCVGVAFKNTGYKELEEIFGNAYSPEKGKPTNSEFIAAIVEYLKYNEDV